MRVVATKTAALPSQYERAAPRIRVRRRRAVSTQVRPFDATPLLLVFILLVSLIPARWVLPGLGAAGRPASLFGVGLFALWAVIQFVPSIDTRPTKLRWLILANAAALMVSYALGQGRGLTSAESLSADRALIGLVAFSGVLLMASEGIPTVDHLDRLTKQITYAAGFMAVVGIVQFLLRIDPYTSIRFPGLVLNAELGEGFGTRGAGQLVRVRSSTLHPIEFSVTMALGLPLAIHHAIHEPSLILRRRRQVLAAVIAGASMLAVSRSAVVGVACALLVLLWGWSPRLRLAAAGAGVIFIVGLRALVPGLVGTLRSLFTNLFNDPSVTGRTADYDRIAPYVQDRPFFGRGVGTFLPDQYILLDNTYLGRLVATGLAGLVALVVLLFTAAFMARHCLRRNPDNQIRHLALAILAMIFVGIVGGGTFDFLFFPTASGIYLVALGAAAFLGTYNQEQFRRPRPTPPGTMRFAYQAERPGHRWWHRFDPDLKPIQ